MLVTDSRPRNLKWIHAGPLLYGDWGTSRLYVLGLAFLFTGHTSVLYLAAIGLLMLAVSWAYTIVCREFPDGGGVYTAARRLSPTLSVVGATLLLSGYIMTAAISVIEAWHYFGVPHDLTWPLSVLTLVLVAGVNWLGAKSAGRFALVFVSFIGDDTTNDTADQRGSQIACASLACSGCHKYGSGQCGPKRLGRHRPHLYGLLVIESR